jgi:hypothetical protein
LHIGVQSGLAPIGSDFIAALALLLFSGKKYKIEGDYDDINLMLSNIIMEETASGLLEQARKSREIREGSLYDNLAFVIKRRVDHDRNRAAT